MTRAKVLMSAYACGPDRGSEPGIGWNTAREMATRHDLWLMTSRENQPRIQEELVNQGSSLRVIFVDWPKWLDWIKLSRIGWEVHHYSWALLAYLEARRLHRTVGFDVVHHVTIGRYWMPSFLAMLPIPFIWGPVGGGESMPAGFWRGLGTRGMAIEATRACARWIVERDPFLVQTAKRSILALATTEESGAQIATLGARSIRVISQIGITEAELDALASCRSPEGGPIRYVSIGRLVFWKGFHLGLRAFARLEQRDAEYWIIGTGPAEASLVALVKELGLTDRVRFFGGLSRQETLDCLAQVHVLVHPSLHEAGGMVCVEAMAAGKPIVCIDRAGPAMQVTADTGFKIAAGSPEQAVADITAAMSRLHSSPELRERMGAAGRLRARDFSWRVRGEYLSAFYEAACSA